MYQYIMSSEFSSPRTGVSLAFGCLLLLGALPILAVRRPGHFDSLTFAFWLTVWQLLCALPAYAVERARGKHVSAPDRMVALTSLLFGVATYMYVVAAEKAGPVNMSIALQAYPLFAAMLESAFLGRRKSVPALAFTALMIAGLFYLTTGGTFRLGGISGWSLFALGIPLLWSIAHILLRRLLAAGSVTPNQVTVTRLAVSGAFLLICHAAAGSHGALLEELTDVPLQTSALLMGGVYYLELILWFHAMKHIDVSVASSVTVPAPAVTMLVSALLLGEEVHRYQIFALAVITLGLYGLLYSQFTGDSNGKSVVHHGRQPRAGR